MDAFAVLFSVFLLAIFLIAWKSHFFTYSSPQGYPSAQFLLQHGVRRVVLVQQRAGQPQEDLSHVILRWQEAGIRLEAYGVNAGESLPLTVSQPSHFRALWQRALAILGLRRGAFGGFGDWPHGTGGG